MSSITVSNLSVYSSNSGDISVGNDGFISGSMSADLKNEGGSSENVRYSLKVEDSDGNNIYADDVVYLAAGSSGSVETTVSPPLRVTYTTAGRRTVTATASVAGETDTATTSFDVS